MPNFTVTRRIGIDAGHRVMTHGSKCRHMHGHRYTIEATCQAREAKLHESGEQTDMVIDFSFLKEEMMRQIDAPCDHGFIASIKDEALLRMFCPDGEIFAAWYEDLNERVELDDHCMTTNTRLATKLYLIRHQPTAECLAAHWFHRLSKPVDELSDNIAVMARVRVWETPNCYSDYTNPEMAWIDD